MNSRVKSKIMLCLASLSVIFNAGYGVFACETPIPGDDDRQTNSEVGEVEHGRRYGRHRRHHAADIRYFPVVDAELHLGDRIDARVDALGNTQLHHAVLWGDIGRVNALLDAGADANLLNRNDETPLHIAVAFCRADMVEALLNHGADPNVVGHAPGIGRRDERDIPLAFVRRHEGAQRDTAALRIRDLLLRAGSESRPFENASFVPEDLDDLPLHMAPPPAM